MRTIALAIILMLLCSAETLAQQAHADTIPHLPCSADDVHEKLLNSDPAYKQKVNEIEQQIQQLIQDPTWRMRNNPDTRSDNQAIVYTIPVVVHIMHLGEAIGTGTNISDAQILGAISGLNDRFRNIIGNSMDVEIQFCLASLDPNGLATTGINRINASAVPLYSTGGIGLTGATCTSALELSIKNLSRWPNTSYYNIWIVNSVCNGSYGGYAYYPGASAAYDGTVIVHNQFKYNDYTTAHELGHGFNLYHTFQGYSGSTCPANTNCTIDGDRCCDTPPQKQNDCSTANPCSISGTWENSRYNYMSYCWPSNAMGRFTPDQTNRMRATLSVSPRSSLLTSQGCGTAVPPSCYNDNACTAMSFAIGTSGSCISSTCGTINATAPSPDIPFRGGVNCTTQFESSRYDDDVWFRITTSSSSALTIVATPTSNTSNFDIVFGVYTGTCSNLYQVKCASTAGVGEAETLTFTPLANTNYYIRVFSYGTGNAYTGNFNICAYTNCAVPEAVTVTGAGSYCNSQTLTASGGAGGTIYWQSTNNLGTSLSNASVGNVVTETGTYYYRAYNSCGWGIPGSAVVNIATSVPLAASVTGGGVVCNSTTLYGTGGTNGTMYWQGSTINGTSTATPASSRSVNSSGTYYYRAYNGCGWGPQGSSTVTVTTTVPSAVTVTGGGPTCSSLTLTATGGTQGTIYWQGTNSSGTSRTTAATSQMVSASGVYYFRSFNECGWGPSGSATVTVNTGPNQWTGSVSGAWENTSNWSCGVLPTATTDVVINSGSVVLNSNAVVRSLTLMPGVVFTVGAGYSFTIAN